MTDAEFRSEYTSEFIAGTGGLFAGDDRDRMFDPQIRALDPHAAPPGLKLVRSESEASA